MSSDVFKRRALFWKEARELFPVGILLLLLPMAGLVSARLLEVVVARGFAEEASNELSLVMVLLSGAGSILAAAIVGALMFRGCELKVGGCVADQLPISRWRILTTKVLAMLMMSIAFLLLFPFPWYLISQGNHLPQNNYSTFCLITACAYGYILLVGLLSMVLRCIYPSGVSSVVMTILTGGIILILFYTRFNYLRAIVFIPSAIDAYLLFVQKQAYELLFLLILIAFPLVVSLSLTYRSRVLRETGYLGRFLIGLLFSWCLVVYVFTIAFASWADLRLLIFGAS